MPTAEDLLRFAENLIIRWGIIIVPIGAFLENSVILSFIFPGVTVIFLSGFVARGGDVNLAAVILLAILGSTLGDNFDYLIGRRAGRILAEKPLFAKPISKVEPLLAAHGAWAIFGGRFSAWSRAWVALACGILKFNYLKFAAVSALSATVWTTGWVIGGYLVGGNRELIAQWFARASLVVWAIFLALVIYYFRTRIKLVLDLVVFLSKKWSGKVKDGFNNKF